jgi:hypothetical protein
MVIKVVLGIVIAASAACSYSNGFFDCEVACTSSSGCPDGFTCSVTEGLCRDGATAASCAEVIDRSADAGADSGAIADGGASSCPAAFGGGRYLFVNTLMEWPAAEAYCRSLAATASAAPYVHLVVINDSTELGLLTPTGTPLDDAWIGYTDSKSPSSSTDAATIAANFRWVTDEQAAPGFAMWSSGQPDNSSTPRCGYKSFSTGLMHDRTCTGHTRTFFCECDQFPENPNNL